MNKVIALGNLTKDIELTQSQGGIAIAKTSLAINEGYKDKDGNKIEKTTFLNLTAFGHTANHLNKRFKKGSKVLIEGKIQNSSYEKEDGTKVYRTDIIVDQVHFAGGKSDGQNEQTGIESDEDFAKRVKKEKEEEISIEDIPW